MDQTALFKLSYGLYVVGVKNGDSFGGCIVDAMMQVTSDMPPLLMLGSMRNYPISPSGKQGNSPFLCCVQMQIRF